MDDPQERAPETRVAIDTMTEPTVIAFPGSTQPFLKSLERLRGAGWIDYGSEPARTIMVRRGPRSYGEPVDAAATLEVGSV